MPVHHVEGNLFDGIGSKVVTCNTRGAMGAGIALECKQRYPVVYWLHGMGGDPRRGGTFVRLPHVPKPETENLRYSYGMFFRLKEKR